jgi:hypothetical protein
LQILQRLGAGEDSGRNAAKLVSVKAQVLKESENCL